MNIEHTDPSTDLLETGWNIKYKYKYIPYLNQRTVIDKTPQIRQENTQSEMFEETKES